MVTYEELVYESPDEEDNGDDGPAVLQRMAPGEFYFSVGEYDGFTAVTIVPKVFWDREGYLWDLMRGLSHILPPHLSNAMEAVWETERGVDEVREEMSALGFVLNDAIGEPAGD